VLFVGRLIPRKGLPYLVEAAKTVVKERSETLFVIAGDGPLKDQTISEVEQAGLGRNFIFLGDVSEEELPRLYSCADLFALPSIQEGQGIVLLEAQAAALPVIAFNVSGVSETVLDKKTGLLVDPQNDEFAQAILKVLSDDSLRRKLGESGRARILRELTWDVCAQKMLAVYREAAQLS
jgi:glycosyltransferase involved in cell wall biosynthesis